MYRHMQKITASYRYHLNTIWEVGESLHETAPVTLLWIHHCVVPVAPAT